jgi:hypothetical protein
LDPITTGLISIAQAGHHRSVSVPDSVFAALREQHSKECEQAAEKVSEKYRSSNAADGIETVDASRIFAIE